MTAFHRMLIGMTPMWVIMTKADARDFYAFTRERTLFVLDRLPAIAKIPEPTFTFAHIVCPHPPFVFGEAGEDISPRRGLFSLADGDRYAKQYSGAAGYRDGYRRQAMFLTKQVEQTIGASSPPRPSHPSSFSSPITAQGCFTTWTTWRRPTSTSGWGFSTVSMFRKRNMTGSPTAPRRSTRFGSS